MAYYLLSAKSIVVHKLGKLLLSITCIIWAHFPGKRTLFKILVRYGNFFFWLRRHNIGRCSSVTASAAKFLYASTARYMDAGDLGLSGSRPY